MAKTTSINYPNDCLPVPLQDGFGLKPVSPLLRTELTSGRARQRRLYTSTPTQASVAWLFTDPEAQLFEAWFRIPSKMGLTGSTCLFAHLLALTTCTFAGSSIFMKGRPLRGNYWRYTATLELWERPVLALVGLISRITLSTAALLILCSTGSGPDRDNSESSLRLIW